jgi:death-on-curing protein
MKELIWLDEHDALILHDRLLALHGGAEGVRDDNLLKSALACPRQHFAYAGGTGVVQLVSLYTAGVARNHPFVDGNNRTGFVIGILFLELNGYAFTASEEDAAQAVIALASGVIEETGYAEFLSTNSHIRNHKTD